MNMKKILLVLLSAGIITASSCQKEYLEKKPDRSLLVPSTLEDFQSLMDNLDVFNISPSLPIIASDDFFGNDDNINTLATPYEKNSYLWQKDIDEGMTIGDWQIPYQQVFYANIILDGMDHIKRTADNAADWDRIKGMTLFHRAYAFFNIAQMYAAPYDTQTANSTLGIPVRLHADVTVKSERSTLAQSYNQIIEDLKLAGQLLPLSQAFQNRPTHISAQALLARVSLSMQDYQSALEYADSVLKHGVVLKNYSALDTMATVPFPVVPTYSNEEVLFYSQTTVETFGLATSTTVSDTLYTQYLSGDLRKVVFYGNNGDGSYWFKGRYTGLSYLFFSGIASDEVYLIKAECEARKGNVSIAMRYLNDLLRSRWNKGMSFTEFTAETEEAALRLILRERRKELAFRGLRWGDLRRLNMEDRFRTTITRTFEGDEYILEPNSPRYTFPIPQTEINSSGIEQNPR